MEPPQGPLDRADWASPYMESGDEQGWAPIKGQSLEVALLHVIVRPSRTLCGQPYPCFTNFFCYNL